MGSSAQAVLLPAQPPASKHQHNRRRVVTFEAISIAQPTSTCSPWKGGLQVAGRFRGAHHSDDCLCLLRAHSLLQQISTRDHVISREGEDGVQEINITSNNSLYQHLQNCIDGNNQRAGRYIHYLIVQCGFECDMFWASHLIRMFTAFSDLSKAQQVFLKISQPNIYIWRAIITSHAKLGENKMATRLYYHMQCEDMIPNEYIFVAVLGACTSARAFPEGMTIHAHAIDGGLDTDIFVANALIDMYTKCGSSGDAHIMFNRSPKVDIVSWNTMFSCLSEDEEVLVLFQKMHQQGMVDPTQATLVCVLKACSRIEYADQGKMVHFYSIECGFESDLYVSSALVDMYGKCESLDDSKAVFEGLALRDSVLWNAYISGFALQGHGREALILFSQMRKEGKEPDEVTFSCILKGCSSSAALEQGKLIHMEIVERGFESNIFIGGALIDMYSKCGSLGDACIVFDRLPKKDIVTWSTMILGYSLYGNHSMALQCFTGMQRAGLKPNDVTFLCLLSAFSHLGMAEEGCLHFKAMREEYNIFPTLRHLNSMVELFGQSGLLSGAEDLLECIPARSNLAGWRSLLSASRLQGDVCLGLRCFDRVVAMDCRKASGYLLMSNIFAQAGMYHEANEVERLRRCANALKKPGKALIEVDKVVHEFSVADKTHPQIDMVHEKLKKMSVLMRLSGYKPNLNVLLDATTDDEKEDALCGHCERLALAFGLTSTPPGTSIRILKNLRMCADCHASMKIISKMELRQIFISDTYCMHCFSDGECSCKDSY